MKILNIINKFRGITFQAAQLFNTREIFDVCTTELSQSCQKVQKLVFQSQFSTFLNLSYFFSLNNINLGEQFLVDIFQ